jgi:hypothetical protein
MSCVFLCDVNSSLILQKISGKELVVDRIVEQIVGPKINSSLLPEVSIEFVLC